MALFEDLADRPLVIATFHGVARIDSARRGACVAGRSAKGRSCSAVAIAIAAQQAAASRTPVMRSDGVETNPDAPEEKNEAEERGK